MSVHLCMLDYLGTCASACRAMSLLLRGVRIERGDMAVHIRARGGSCGVAAAAQGSAKFLLSKVLQLDVSATLVPVQTDSLSSLAQHVTSPWSSCQ